jgi:hypothetical protein
MTINPPYGRCSSVDAFESHDQQRLLLFHRRTGELMLLVDRSADLWRRLDERPELDLSGEDYLVLESLYRRGFVERGRMSK